MEHNGTQIRECKNKTQRKFKIMKEIIIYEFQLKAIYEALRITNNIHKSGLGKTCHDRMVRQALKYSENALEGKKDEVVKYV